MRRPCSTGPGRYASCGRSSCRKRGRRSSRCRLFHFFFAWNDFLAPLVYLVGHEELWPISVGMSYFTGQYVQLPQLIQATALMALALPVLIFVLAQKVFVQGVVVTGVEK